MILTWAALTAFGWSHAQEFKFGPKAGLNLSTFVGGDASEDNKILIGYQVGGVAEIKFGRFALQPEIQYSMQGTRVEGRTRDSFSERYESKIHMGYLQIPVLARFYAFKGFSVEVGPQIGFLLSAKNDYKSDSFNYTNRNVKGYYSDVDVAINAGLGYDFSNGIFTGARYTFGLSSLDNDLDFDARNSVIGIYGGFKF